MDSVVDGSLEGLITMKADFDAEGFVVVLERSPLCVDLIGADDVYRISHGILVGLIITLIEGFLHWQLRHCNSCSPYVNCCLNNFFFVASNKS